MTIPPKYQLALYDPDGPADELDTLLCSPFHNNAADRWQMRAAVLRFFELERQKGPCGLKIRAVPCDENDEPIGFRLADDWQAEPSDD